MNPPVKYIATIHDVREVMLVAAADLAYWRDRLARERLFPYCVDAKAQVMISAIGSKWMSMPFRELCVSVAVSLREDGASHDGYFLAAAFNSSRFFSLCERTLFHTPYRRGSIDLDTGPKSSLALRDGNAVILHAQKSYAAAATTLIDEQWEGKLFIPGGTRKQGTGNFFFAKLGGPTDVHSFSPACDTCHLSPLNNQAVVQWLVDSRLQPKEWHIRQHATHARSKTYNRID